MPYSDPEEQRAYQRRWLKERRNNWIANNGPCVDCESWENLEVDHVDRTQKVTNAVWSWSYKRRMQELSKCVTRCSECHKKKTSKELKELFSRPITHGTISAYLQRKCKCDICRAFYRKWRRDKYERIGK